MTIIETLEKLSNVNGISGSEEAVMKVVSNELAPYTDSIHIDTLGNLIAVKKGTSGKKIMVAAHADEIGLALVVVAS